MRRRGMIKTLGVVAVAVVVAGVVIYAALRPPIGWPTEDRRVSHPAGFSVIAPEGWERHIIRRTDERSADVLRFLPAKVVGTPGFFSLTKVVVIPTEPQLAERGYASATFVGKPAWTKETLQKGSREHTRNLIFERDGNWFEFMLRRPLPESLDSGTWQAYLESFRTETPKAIAAEPILPATLPATLP